jgi:hypothetical protein
MSDDFTGAYIDLKAENAALREAVAMAEALVLSHEGHIEKLEAALALYGEHTVECEREEAGGTCICGLDALLAAQSPED